MTGMDCEIILAGRIAGAVFAKYNVAAAAGRGRSALVVLEVVASIEYAGARSWKSSCRVQRHTCNVTPHLARHWCWHSHCRSRSYVPSSLKYINKI
jgi:hypothetical protein